MRLIDAYLSDWRQGSSRRFLTQHTREEFLQLAETEELHFTLSEPVAMDRCGEQFESLGRPAMNA